MSENCVYKHISGEFQLNNAVFTSFSNPNYQRINEEEWFELLGTCDVTGTPFDTYIVLKFCCVRKELSIFSDILGGSHYLYFCNVDNKIYFSSSLKKLLTISSICPELNLNVLNDFVVHGFIPNNSTLIKNVYKLLATQKLVIKKDKISLIDNTPSWNSHEKDSSANRFYYQEEQLLKKYLSKLHNKKEYGITLSAGFDSNLILHHFLQINNNPTIVSVGENSHMSELNNVAKICDFYNIDKKIFTYVTKNSMKYYEDIVERLEGSVFEPGIFLQYVLAKEVSARGISQIICGECADQIFNETFFSGTFFASDIYKFGKNPYELASSIIIKKSGIMLNSFGIDGFYPYCTSEMINLGNEFKKNNGRTKVLHKISCGRCLPDNIYNLIKKQGGSTSLETLFESECEIKEFKQSVLGDSVYGLVTSECTRRFGPNYDYELLKALCIRYLEIFKKIYCK